jgi:predicted GH43/DUF377 family glycosyl hydrolase
MQGKGLKAFCFVLRVPLLPTVYAFKARTASYFITPDKDYEKVGEVNNVCFVEGLVYFKEKWFLYYGTADSKIAVAVFDPSLKK